MFVSFLFFGYSIVICSLVILLSLTEIKKMKQVSWMLKSLNPAQGVEMFVACSRTESKLKYSLGMYRSCCLEIVSTELAGEHS